MKSSIICVKLTTKACTQYNYRNIGMPLHLRVHLKKTLKNFNLLSFK